MRHGPATLGGTVDTQDSCTSSNGTGRYSTNSAVFDNHPKCLFHQIPVEYQFVRTPIFPHPSPSHRGGLTLSTVVHRNVDLRLHQALQETKFQGRHGLSGRDLQALALRWEIPAEIRVKGK